MPERTADLLERTDSGSVAVLRLAHGPVNLMDIELLHAVTERFRSLAADPPAAVVLTGGGRTFSAGVDLHRLLDGGSGQVAEFLPALDQALLSVFTFERPVVAAVNGHAIAGGALLAACADARLMAEGSGRIGTPELAVGVSFPRVTLEILAAAFGPVVARRLLLGADTIGPAEALTLGLLDEVVDPGALLERAVAVATRLATDIPPDTFAITKAQLHREAMDRIARYRADEDPRSLEVWNRRMADGWTADYLDRVTRKA